MIGKTISHYKILEKLGGGGMGVVYKAEDTKLKRLVALKFLSPELTRDPEAKSRFLHEAQAASALDHGNICNIHEIDEAEDGQLFIVMAFYEGETLKKRIERGLLKVDDAIGITIQVACGLSKAHEVGITHRDIKPANILITNDGVVKIVDFGLAKLAGQTQLTKTGIPVGTIAYRSPEQTRGETVDRRTDIWSLGVVVYQMLTGQLPFKGDYEQAIIYSILNEQPVNMTDVHSDLPHEAEKIIRKTLAKCPDERFQNIDEMLVELKTLSKQYDTWEKKKQSLPQKTALRKKVYFYTGITSVLIALVIMIVGYFLPKHGEVIDSIAVLPLQNLSGDPEQEYFSDGMTESLICELSKIKALRVISRQSVMRYKGSNEPLPEIAVKLNVDAVVEGSVLRADDQVRITVQLVKASPEQHIWAEDYKRDLRDILALQDEVTQAIAREVKIAVTPEEHIMISSGRPVNPEAHETYLKGRFFIEKWTEADLSKGVDYLKQAIEIDANYAFAYSGLARAYEYLIWLGWISPDEGWPVIKTNAMKAMQIDETLAEAHVMLSESKFIYDYDWQEAATGFKRSIELNPGYAITHAQYAWYLSAMGKHYEAIEKIERAKELDPLSVVMLQSAGWIYYFSRQYDKAVKQLNDILVLDPDFAIAHMSLGTVLLQKKKYEEAIAKVREAIALKGGSLTETELTRAYALSGKTYQAREHLKILIERSKHRYVSAYLIATIYAALGEKDQAIQWLESAFDERSNDMVLVKVDPRLDNLRSDARFTALLNKMGFEQ